MGELGRGELSRLTAKLFWFWRWRVNRKFLLRVYNGNWTEWDAIWSEIIRVISKSNKRAARVRFVITSMISDQNCTPLSSITTLLNPFWNRPNTGLGNSNISLMQNWGGFLNKKRNRETLLLQYAIEQRATFNQVARARYFWLLESSVITYILKSPKYRTWSIQIFYWCSTELVFK